MVTWRHSSPLYFLCFIGFFALALQVLSILSIMISTTIFVCATPKWLCCTITLEFSQSVVAFLVTFTSISKPELYNRKFGLVSRETAVFTPYTVIRFTVTAITAVCTCVGHPASAFITDICSAPVSHHSRITWYPPIYYNRLVHHCIKTLVLDELLAMRRDCGKTGQLRYIRPSVVNDTWVAACSFKSMHKSPVLTVVTDDCNANSMSQYTENGSRSLSPCGSIS